MLTSIQRLGIVILVASSLNIASYATHPQPSIAKTVTLPDGSSCEGQFQGLNGTGLCVYSPGNPSDYDYYRGEIRNGEPNGRGLLVYKNRDRYEGQFRNGMPDGVGMFLFTSGDRYEGQFRNGKANGRGTFTFTNGDRYLGQLQNGYPHGTGTFTFASGQIYSGQFYLGQVNGRGVVILPGVVRCEGTFYNSSLDGKGTCTNLNPENPSYVRYTGEIRDGRPYGRGTYN